MNNLPENISPEILASYLSNQHSDTDAILVNSWIDASSQNRKNFEQIKTIWEETGKISPVPIDIDVDAAWDRMSIRINNDDVLKKNIKKNKPKLFIDRKIMRVAAILLPFIMISSILFLLNRKVERISYITKTETRKDTLSDGSVVTLNRYSKLNFPQKFKGESREVELEGEAFFEIYPDKEKPFIIKAENTMIKVVGTSFNVRSIGEDNVIEIFVKTGSVLFSDLSGESAKTNSICINAGEKGVFNKRNHQFSKTEDDDRIELFWNEKILKFNRTELYKVTQVLKKVYGETVELKQENLKKMHFSATFENLPIDSVLNVIVKTFDLNLRKENGKFVLEQNEN